MSISFNQIPINLLTPGQYVEFDNSKAVGGLVNETARILLFAPKLSTGTGKANTPIMVTRSSEGVDVFGLGSIGAAMLESIFEITRTIETWVVPIEDPSAGTAAKGTVTVTGTATESGTISLYVAGKLVQVGVALGVEATDVAEAIETALNAELELPVTASAAEGVVTVTCRHKGTIGNDIDLRTNYYSSQKDVQGISVVCVSCTGGSGTPDIDDAIAALDEKQYNTMICAWADDTVLAALEAELDKRWGPMYQNDGHLHCCFRGTGGESNT